ncbi:dockerin type I domain-containing protein [Porcipelethomonas sp.]|uniref:dockerin type I domain-containing protein n=1 Tax=Porcipelethomonas sp. TaxID=2981675 RepID=UPI003EF83ADC
MKKNTIMKASAILATAVMAAAANGTMVSAKEAAPRTVKRSKKNDIVSVESIELSDAQAVAGKMASVTLSMETNNTCAAYDLLVEYDPALKLERVIGANACDTFDNYVALIGYGSEAYKDNKPVVTLQFTVPDDAETGQIYDVKFSEIRTFSTFDSDYENYESYDGTIEVLEETKRRPDYMVFEKYDDKTGNLLEQKPGLRGDVDGDGKVNVRDAATIARHCASSFKGEEVIDTDEGKFFGNVNEDDKLAINDAAAVSRYLSRKSVEDVSWDDIIK